MSEWLQQEMKKTEESRMKKTGNLGKRLIITVILTVILDVAAYFLSSGIPDYSPVYLCGFITAIGFLVILVFALNNKSAHKREVLPRTRKNLEQLQLTAEQLAEFDKEMLGSPLCNIGSDSEGEFIRFTEHYLVTSFFSAGELEYSFTCLAHIASVKSAKTKDRSFEVAYFVDLCGADGKKINGLTVHGRKQMEVFQEALRKYCPNVQM